jgi:hypothetical protein
MLLYGFTGDEKSSDEGTEEEGAGSAVESEEADQSAVVKARIGSVSRENEPEDRALVL